MAKNPSGTQPAKLKAAPKKRGRPSKRPASEPAEKKVLEPVVEPAEEQAEPELGDEQIEELGRAEEEEAKEPSPSTTALAPRTEKGLAPRDALARYMADVERHPLLSREQEHELAVRYLKTGDVDAAYRLVTANLRLVVKIAHEYHRNTFALLDLVQEGNVGLMHAVKKYDPYRGVKLSSYAAWWIRAYILRYIMDNWRMVKLGTTQAQRKLFFNLRKEQEKLAAQGFDPTPKLLAERLKVSEQDVVEMDQRLSQDEFSIDAPVNDDQRGTRADRISLPSAPADERLADHQLKEILKAQLAEFGKTLKDKELYIFQHRLTAEEPMTLQEIGDQYGITRERARQIEAKLVKDLRAWMERAVPDFKDLEIGPRSD